MKVFVLVFALCALASAYPRAVKEEDSKEDDSASDTELFMVPLQPRHPSFGFGLADELAPPPLNQHPFFRVSPWGQPAVQEQNDDFAAQMQAMLSEMRRQITEMLHRSHSAGVLPGDSGVGVSTKVGDDELPKNKSTSTTKVIDGHVVTVNETTYSSGDDNMGAVFRIKVVEVLPSEAPEGEGDAEVKPDSEAKPESEAKPDTENKPEPEPTTSESDKDDDKHEETNEIPKVFNEWSAELDPSLNEVDQLDSGLDERWELNPSKKENYYDLHSDTKVNDYFSDQAQSQGLVMIEPDAELVDADHNSYYRYESLPQRIQRFP